MIFFVDGRVPLFFVVGKISFSLEQIKKYSTDIATTHRQRMFGFLPLGWLSRATLSSPFKWPFARVKAGLKNENMK
jgi:hypothetical protein